MMTPAQYQHPTMQPFSRGEWKEIACSWVIGIVATGLILLTL